MTATKLMTVEDLWELQEVPGIRFELVNGELIEVPGATLTHGLIAAVLYRLMFAFASDHRLGIVVPDGVAFVLQRHPSIVRIPDVAFVSRERIPEDGSRDTYFPGAPDIAVEIVSANDRANEIEAKVEQYLRAGTRLVWIVWPETRSVTVNTPERVARRLQAHETLDGSDVLPGFAVPIERLFEIDP